MLIAALLRIVKKWRQPKCPSMNEEINKMHILCEYYSSVKKIIDIYHSIGEPYKYAKCNESDVKKHLLYESRYTKCQSRQSHRQQVNLMPGTVGGKV